MQLLLHQGDKLPHATLKEVAIAGLQIRMLHPKMGQPQLCVAEVMQLSFFNSTLVPLVPVRHVVSFPVEKWKTIDIFTKETILLMPSLENKWIY